MKNRTTLFAILLMLSWMHITAQAPRTVLFQHFSQASCGPCAAQNPTFVKNVLVPDSNKIHHFVIHTSWPGYDPMYNANKAQPDSLVSYYNVSGVPDVIMDGNQKSGSPTLFTTSDVLTENSKSSPVKITVRLKDNGKDDSVWVKITTVGNIPTGDYRLRTAIIERMVHYSSAPGSNGEKDFPDVFRRMLPNVNGEKLTLPSKGSSLTYTYDFKKDTNWVASQIACVAYIQDDNTLSVINSNSNYDAPNTSLMIAPDQLVKNVAASTPFMFNGNVGNSGDSAEQYKVVLQSTQPTGWVSNFTLDSSTYNDSATITINAGILKNLTLNVTPGSTPFVGNYILTLYSLTHPNNTPWTLTLNVISGVTDLLVNNSNGIGDNRTKGDAGNWMNLYMNGLKTTGSTTLAYTNDKVLKQAMIDTAMHGVKYVYFNIGWTFPALTDNLIAQLKTFLNGGGRLYIGGQDVAWATFSSASTYATAVAQSFIHSYFGVDFVYDGDSTDLTVSPINSEIFDSVPTFNLTNYYGRDSATGVPLFYPDNIKKFGSGIPVFYYNSSSSVIAGMRKSNGNYKTVYFAPGLELVADSASRNHIMRITYQWFHGIITDVQFDYLASHFIKAYPIPSNISTTIAMPDNFAGNVDIYDLTGKKVYHNLINKNETSVLVNTESWAPGTYICQMSNGLTLKLQVIH